MFKKIPQDSDFDGKIAFNDNRSFDLRSTIEESVDLPAEVLRADFSQIHDRILNPEILSALIAPSTSDTDTATQSKRRYHRERALMPYLGKRLVCVCIRLPGVLYTIEIDAEVEKVIHWEWHSI